MRKTRTPQIKRKLEIEYCFHPKDNYERVHWMYCEVSGANDAECKDKAKSYYESQIRSLGWGRITTLKEIRPLRNTNDPHPRKSNSDLSGSRSTESSSGGNSKSSAGKKRRTTGKAAGAAKSTTGGTRKGTKSSTRAKKSK